MSTAACAKILLVDDSDVVRTVLSLALRQAGYATVQAGNGQEALTKLDGVAAVVCDLHMPTMGGLEFLRCLRQNPHTVDLPLFFASVETREADKAVGRELCAAGWLTKPVRPPQLIEALARVIGAPQGLPEQA
jgi:two-component system, chemotaxis family, chemotaxis protein CheY